ncbi:MFS multidrug transporter-like protein [Lophiostoma macrostomum CBS 122681]|uniref:MFS multidrug transporter-like protein n=1 Tax=Lophiostoma macrostomum CBS 122681 TaxID=1314788 RepID=A0A6A6TJZ3_9PLEO|nr:MFS multidrug transporter-like protein [Lophiostoma macrostomum CBS 122681]
MTSYSDPKLPATKAAENDSPLGGQSLEPLTPDCGEGIPNDEPIYFKGPRFWLIWCSIVLEVALTSLEVPVVTTSVATITDDLGRFDKATWITSAYLLGYVGVLIIWAKLSDIFGRKALWVLSSILFIAFSAACGAAQTLSQLIIFRAFQGIGGGGIYSIGTIVNFELVPPSKHQLVVGSAAFVFGITLTLGPIIGGALSKSTHWRWIFLLNVPAAFPALVIILIYLPSSFPHHGKLSHQNWSFRKAFTDSNLARIDVIGVFAIWLGILGIVSALEQAGISHQWNSGFVIAMLVVGGLLILGFVTWEWYISKETRIIEPVFPWTFATDRVLLGLLLCAFSQGMPWICALFQLPQKFQVVHGESPLAAGIKTIPFSAAAPVSSVTAAIIAKKGVPMIYIVLVASILQIVGLSLLGTLPLSEHILKAQYGYQVITGAGAGTNSSILLTMAPLVVKRQKDKSIIVGAFNQFRFVGGVLALAIISSVMTGFVKPKLGAFLSPGQVNLVLDTSRGLSVLKGVQHNEAVRILADGYNLQFKILAGLAAMQVIGTAMMWQKKQLRAP